MEPEDDNRCVKCSVFCLCTWHLVAAVTVLVEGNHIDKWVVRNEDLLGVTARRVVQVKRHFGDLPSRNHQNSDVTSHPGDSVYTGLFISPSGISDPCGIVAGMVTPKGSMSTEGETLQVSVLSYRCSIC